jgi:sphinganine-1-phosphate aldolase
VFEAVDAIVAGTTDIPGVEVLVRPQAALVALVALVPDGSGDAFTVCDEMATRGWYVQPQMSYASTPPTIHLSVSAATFLDRLTRPNR